MGGSIKRDIVNPDLIDERKKCNFDQREMASFVLGETVIGEFEEMVEAIKSDPKLKTDLKFFSLPREQQ